MKFRIGLATARVLLVLIYPMVVVSRLIRYLAGYRKAVYVSTIEGDPLAYVGELPLLIAVWEESASVWDATAIVVDQLRQEFAGRCEFAFVEATSKSIIERYDAKIVPLLILRYRGQEIERFVNTTELEEVRPAIAAITGLRT